LQIEDGCGQALKKKMLFEMIIDENLGGCGGGKAEEGGLCRPQPLLEFNTKALIMV